MEIRQLKSFQTVANLLSFNKAAEQLHYAQSSISNQVQTLEEELGVQLFDRLGRRIQLTETGEQLLQYANKILELVDETQSEVMANKDPQGSLTIRIPESFGVARLPAVIKEFHSNCPNVKLNFITCAVEGLEKDLRRGITDLAFLLADSVNGSDLTVETLGFESVVLVSGPTHPLTSKKLVHTRDLAGATILLSKVDCSYRRVFEQILEEEEVSDFKSIEFYSVEIIKRCLMAGVGISVLPEIAIAEELSSGSLIVLPWSEQTIDVALLMILYKERWISRPLQAFMQATRKVLSRTIRLKKN